MIKVKNISKVYYDSQRGENQAVNGISFDCSAGEIFGLLGPNGAGKTTTLRMLATLLSPTSGTAFINNFSIIDQPVNVRTSLGFLSSTTGLYPRLTPYETLTFFAKINGLAPERVKSQVKELISKFQIEDYKNVRCEKLSTGMKQKVSIARAIVHDPPVLIFDEPTVGLDVIAAAYTMKAILDLKTKGKCVLYSTHIMSEAEKLCDRIAVIHKGTIMACGTLDELRKLTGKRYLEDIFLSVVGEDLKELTL